MPTADQYASAAERALARIEETSGPLETPCWIWQGARSTGGYGYIRVGGHAGGKVVTVHSLLYRVRTGRRVRRGQILHHRCETRSCANPDHLEVVTPRGHGKRHRREFAACGHVPDIVMGRRRVRRCRDCRNATRRARYRDLRG